MISSLKGTVAEISGAQVTLEVHGVGYELRCSQACLAALSEGQAAALVVYTDVKEDSISLYGFADRLEKQVFLLLTKVKGVGARTASDILSRVDKVELLRIIGAGDLARLQAVALELLAQVVVHLLLQGLEHERTLRVFHGASILPEKNQLQVGKMRAPHFIPQAADRPFMADAAMLC